MWPHCHTKYITNSDATPHTDTVSIVHISSACTYKIETV